MTRAIRALAARPGFTIVTVATLALGFGVNAAVFSLTRTVLLQPLPYRDADRLVQINEANAARGIESTALTPANYAAWRDRVDVFQETTVFRRVQFNVSSGSRAIQVEGFTVAPSFFPMLGIQPAIGRGFTTEEATAGRDNVVLVTDSFWRRFFNGDAAAVGRGITVDGVPCTVIGVLPSSFKIFRVLNRELELFRPLVLDRTERVQSINVWAKLKPGVAVETARAELSTVYDTLPITDRGWTAAVWLLSARFATGPRPVLIALEWAVAFVLLIAGANVANLLLAMSAGRQKELAVRLALGASRWQIVRDLGGETVILATAGGVLAIFLATWVVAILNAVVSFQDISRLEPFRVDGSVVAFTAGLALAVVIVFGILPVRVASDVDVVDALKDSTHGVTAGVSNRRLRQALIIGEVALSIVLTVAAAALTVSAITLHDLERGVSVEGVMTAQVALNDPQYAEPERLVRTANAVIDKLSASPVVETAALVNYPPLSLIRVGVRLTIEGIPPPPGDRPWIARYFVTSPWYFRVVGVQMIAGRDFTAADDLTHTEVAIVSETFARRFWNTTDVIGRRIRPEFGQSHAFWIPRSRGGMVTIVGVVRDVREDGLLDSAGFPQLYLPYAQNPTAVVTIMTRTRGATATASPIREAVRSVDPQLPVSYEHSFDELLRETFARPRELAWLIGSFAGLALLLAAVGVYGVVAFLTTTRAREIAIRMALGATRVGIVKLILRGAMTLAAVGVAVGLVATPLAFRLLRAAVYGVEPWSPSLLASVAVLIAVVCAIASAVPAWRAARTANPRYL
jgi:putative ABC transport system permease protein